MCVNAPGTSLAIDLSSVTEGAHIVIRVIRREPDCELNQAEELDKVCKVTEMVGAAGIPVMLPLPPELENTHQQSSALEPGYFQGQYAGQLIDPEMSGWEERTGRGGYNKAMDWRSSVPRCERYTPIRYWQARFFRILPGIMLE